MKKLIEALHVIQDECNKHCYEDCATCPMYCEDDEDGCLAKCEPSEWKINDKPYKALLL